MKKVLNKRIIIHDRNIKYCGYCLTIPSGQKQLDYHLNSIIHFKQKMKYQSLISFFSFDNFIKIDNRFESSHLESLRNNKKDTHNFIELNTSQSIHKQEKQSSDIIFTSQDVPKDKGFIVLFYFII